MIFLLSVSGNAFDESLKENISETADYLKKNVSSPQFGSIGGEWTVIGLARSGENVPDGYFQKYYNSVEKYVGDLKGVLHEKKHTEYSRLSLALTAIGKNPENVGGYNILLPLGDFEKTIWQGINGSIWALIALDSGDYKIPENFDAKTKATRELYLEHIIKNQNSDGGWSLNGEISEVDLTAMALQALANYQDMPNIKEATEKAINFLSNEQNEKGGFSSGDVETAESCAQVLVALSALEISFYDSRFEKNGKNVLDGIMLYYINGGGFKHTIESSSANLMATEQCFYALVAAERFYEKKQFLYDMKGAKAFEENLNFAGLPKKNADVKKQEIVNPNKTFEDIKNSDSKTAIEALASRNILNGKTVDLFYPESDVTRAEFAAVAARSLGLEAKKETSFSDVEKNDWFFESVETAFCYNIIKGVSDTEFNPNGKITVEEAAVMVERAAKLCGIETEIEESEELDILAVFSDYNDIATWAKKSVAFCFKENILNDDVMEIQPRKPITRAEVSFMIYNLLGAANLL